LINALPLYFDDYPISWRCRNLAIFLSLHRLVHVGSLISAFADQLSSKGYRMTNDIQNEAEHEHDELLDDEFVSISQCHALAAQHFLEAAKQHGLAAEAFDAGNLYETHRRGYLAYRNQLLATQYAEMAAIDEDDEEFEDESSAADGQ
jgi:hypothetical protein